MRKLFISLVCIVATIFAVDRLGGMAMECVCRHTNDVLGPKLRSIRQGITEDVVLIGTSRCHHHYLPSILSDSMGMSVYNAGVGGSNNIYAHYIILRHILDKHTPKVVCLEVSCTDYCLQGNAFNVVSFFAPLFGLNEGADSVYRLAGTYWKYQVSHLYRYNAKASSNIIGLVLNRQKENDNGYIPLSKPDQYPRRLETEETLNDVDDLKREYIQRFIGLCRQHRIKLVFVVSPKYTLVAPCHYKVLKEIARQNGIPFLDYHTQGLYHDHPEYFRDGTHLWDMGARLYSSRFASDLKQL